MTGNISIIFLPTNIISFTIQRAVIYETLEIMHRYSMILKERINYEAQRG